MFTIRNEMESHIPECTNPFTLFEQMSDNDWKKMFSSNLSEQLDDEFCDFPAQIGLDILQKKTSKVESLAVMDDDVSIQANPDIELIIAQKLEPSTREDTIEEEVKVEESKKKYLDCQSFNVKNTIEQHIQSYLEESCEEIGRGRPRKFQGISYSTLAAKARKLFSSIKVTKNTRKDSLNTSIMRKILKLLDMMLKLIGSQTHFKNPDVRKNIQSYFETFSNGFLTLFNKDNDIPTTQLFSFFLNFIVLKFPKERVTLVLKMLKANSDISSSEYNSYISQVEMARKTSVSSFKTLCNLNACLSSICKKLLPILQGTDPLILSGIEEFITKLEFE